MHTDVIVDAKLTGSPELAVALMENGAIPSVTSLSAPNAIVCDAWVTVKLCSTVAAAA
jgi:hypothetical protein